MRTEAGTPGDSGTHTPLVTVSRHTLSGKPRVALAWQSLSSFGVTFPAEKPKHRPPEVVSGPFAKHLPNQHPEETGSRKDRAQQSRGREGPLPESCAPTRETVQELCSCSAPGQRVPGLKSREGTRSGGCEGAQHGAPPQEQPGCESRREGLPPPRRLLRIPEPEHRGRLAVLPNLGLLLPGYFESCSSLAFCRIWQTSVMG